MSSQSRPGNPENSQSAGTPSEGIARCVYFRQFQRLPGARVPGDGSRVISVGSMFKAWGCRPTPRRADARSTAFSPKSPRGLRPLSRLPGPGRGGGNGLFGPPSYPDRSADVVRLHRIFEHTPCLHARISQFLPAFLLFATTSPRIGRHLPARKDVLIDGEAVAESLYAFGLLGANGGDLRQRRYPDRYAGVASASPHRPPGTAAGHCCQSAIGDSPQKTCFHTKGFEISGFGDHLGEPTTKSRDGLSTASIQANEGTPDDPDLS